MHVQGYLVLFQIYDVGHRIGASVQLQFAERLVQHVRMGDVPQQYGVIGVVVIDLTKTIG